MPSRAVRFLHASDLHLEQPPYGLDEAPETLRPRLLACPYQAAEKVFQAALDHGVDFVVLSGDVLDVQAAGPPGPLFLAGRFARLAEKDIQVYWAGGNVDHPAAWPSQVPLPDNVHVFADDGVQETLYRRDGQARARVLGLSRREKRIVRVGDFHPDPTGLFTLAVVHGAIDATALAACGVPYWALGGSHEAQTVLDAPCLARFPGTPQGRCPSEFGPHGCTLVNVDEQGKIEASFLPTDVLRWRNERVEVPADAAGELAKTLCKRMREVIQTAPEFELLVAWTVAADPSLARRLQLEKFEHLALQRLREEFAGVKPAAHSVSVSIEPAGEIPDPPGKDQPLLNEFISEVKRLQQDGQAPLDLRTYMGAEPAQPLEHAARFVPPQQRAKFLKQAAQLGFHLLRQERTSTA